MRFFIKILFFVLVFNVFTYSQDPTRPQKIKEWEKITPSKNPTDKMMNRYWELMDEILLPAEKEVLAARKINARAYRLFPDGIMDKMMESYDSYGASAYPFTEIADYPSAMLLEYKTGLFIFNDVNRLGYHGLMANIGQIPIESINEQSREFIALAKYQPPSQEKDIKPEFSADGLTFRKSAAVNIGDTYLLKIISRGDKGGIFALKIIYKDTDNSIVIFVKTIKTFDSPNLPKTNSASGISQRPVIYQKSAEKITEALRKNGFKNVVVDISTTPLTLRGTIPKGKMQDMIKVAQETAGAPLINAVIEK